MANNENLGFGTRAIHGGQEPDPTTGAVMPPIYQTSTYVQEAPGVHKGFEYARTQNPTRIALEKNLAAIENGLDGIAFGSGLAAVDAICKLLKPGDEVISTNDLYGGTYRLFQQIYGKYGIKFTFVPMQGVAAIKQAVTPNTKLIWVETPTNPMLNIIDIKAVAEVAEQAGAWLCVDNTFATPYLQQPLTLGADFVLHSATKYLGGHSDVVLGAVVVKEQALADELHFIQNASGGVCGPMDSFLVLRGIKTLHVRMQQHCKNAEAVAHYLKDHPAVGDVYWPGLQTHANHQVAKNQMKNFGGMVSFNLKAGTFKAASAVASALNVFTLAESLGGVESLAGHPASMTHASIPKAQREEAGVVDSLIRLSVGIEDKDDLIADLEQALARV